MPWRILILWALFLARGTFYCAMLPLWEGWDEYAHFAILQHWADHGTLPESKDPIPREVDASMRLAPLAYELAWIGPPYLTHEQWWQLPPAEREDRRRLLTAIPPTWAHEPAARPFVSYEAQQPPLYYWILCGPLRLAAGWPLQSRVLFLRLLSMAIASLAIPLTWLASKNLLGPGSALYAPAMLAIAPGFAIDTSRIANDSIAIALAALALWLLARRTQWVPMGLALGAALLAKAYLLALVPTLVICWWNRRRDLARALPLALLIGGWWYARNVLIGQSFSGWQQHTGGNVLATTLHINWFKAADVISKSFIWFGAWSFLTLKSWIYRIFEVLALLAASIATRSRGHDLKIPLIVAACYLLQVFYATLLYFKAQGVPNLPGWYLWPVAGAFGIIVAAGLKHTSLLMIGLLGLLDLYGVAAVMLPYYAGLAAKGRVDLSLFPAALARLQLSHALTGVWLCATVAIPVIAGCRSAGLKPTDTPSHSPRQTPPETA